MMHGREHCCGFRAVCLLSVAMGWAVSALAQDYQFDATISRPVLENYLDRSISFTELLHDDLTQAPEPLRGRPA